MNTNTHKIIAIIGGGFSGLATLAELVRQSDKPVTIVIFEKHHRVGTGLAYSSSDPIHLLNVATNNLGIHSDDPEDFYNWLHSKSGQISANQFGIQSPISPAGFLPRALFGEYLQYTLRTTLELAQQKHIKVHQIQSNVTDVMPIDSNAGWQIQFTENSITKTITAHHVVLATGNGLSNTFHSDEARAIALEGLPATAWTTTKSFTHLNDLIQFRPDENVTLLGTGLTMADVVLSLKSLGHRGQITALSRQGQLPRPHASYTPYHRWSWLQHPETIPNNADALHQQFKQELKHAIQQGYDWRAVVDSIRPLTQSIWYNLSIDEKKKFITTYQSLWNIHRHRIPMTSLNVLNDLILQGQLTLISGQITKTNINDSHIQIEYSSNGQSHTLRQRILIDCTGPNQNVYQSRNPLIRNLLSKDLIAPGPLGLGFAISDGYRLKSSHSSPIYGLGATLIGELWECNSIPEIRQQARIIAEQALH